MSLHRALPITGNEFRVLFVRPNEQYDAPLKGQLEVYSFDDTEREPYDTLSYTWDRKYNNHFIELNGQVCYISETVAKALQQIRALGHRRIWVDQLSIDQTNTDERNQQVARMNEIYASGAECFVYLGEGTGSDEDVDWLLRWAHPMRRLRNGWNLKHLLSIQRCEVFPGQRRPWKCCVDYILQQPYFTRTWVLQEIVFSTKITCLIGNKQLSWDLIQALANEIPLMTGHASNLAADRDTIRGPDNLADLNAWKRLWEPLQESSSQSKAHHLDRFVKFMSVIENPLDRELISLLRNACNLQATDPRDKVFALLNIASDGRSFPAPNYALTQDEVYKLYAQVLAERGHAIELLSMNLFRPESQNWPSWVPQWDTPVIEFNFELCTRFNAEGSRISPCHYIDGHLIIKAYRLDCITYRSAAFSNVRCFLEDVAAYIDEFLLGSPYSMEELSIDPTDSSRDLLDLLFCDFEYNRTEIFWDTHLWEDGSDGLGFLQKLLQKLKGNLCHATGSYGGMSHSLQVSYYESLPRLALTLFGKKRSEFDDFKKKLLNISPTEEILQEKARDNPDPRFFKYLRGELMPLCFIFGSHREEDRPGSHERYIGFAHATCMPGNRIMLVKGARAPYIFRKIGPGQYRNLGQAYIRGIMKGEFAETLDRHDWEYVVVA